MTKLRLAPLDLQHPENRAFLAHLAQGRSATEPIARPSSVPDPYQGCGSHPDLVERVWDQLGRGLPRAARALVHGNPALVQAEAGILLAVCLGTEYALRVPPASWAEAENLGLKTSHTYRSAGVTLDLAAFGPGWRFGAWHARELDWVAAENARLG